MKATLAKAARAFVAAITSPEAVKQEKSLAVLVVTRVLLAIGAGDALVQLVQKLVG
jgi:hypothetical protein